MRTRCSIAERVEVLYVHQDGLVTGSAISLRNLILGLDRRRVSARVVLAQEGPARQLYETLDVPVDTIPIRGMWTAPGPQFPTPDYFRNWLALLPNQRLTQFLRHRRPALVHVNDKTLLAAGLAARQEGIPVVWHLRSTYAAAHSALQARVSCKRIRAAADRLIAISEDEVDGFEGLPQLSIVYNSVDFEQVEHARQQVTRVRAELGIAPDEVLVGTISTVLSEKRGSWDFIQAAGLLRSLMPKTRMRFVIVAKITNRETEAEAWRRAEEAGIREQLILTGFRSDALSVMAAMDVVTACNRLGILGRMPFEAMALGRPLVVTAGHSGRSRVVLDGETALVVPVSASAIADGIARLLNDSTLRERLARNGAAYARRHFDPVTNGQAIMNIYDEVVRQ